ncbi:Scramblase-domain-containing protein [Endogone sp. FLAS-F59071]|nr:Scramblase-domain-containing protein [Endogone sp. FLAS-F59071]|eukprot:RUS23317.1 Scramblase-domain-containing protein [Endogone sp. FLAS-F59071]
MNLLARSLPPRTLRHALFLRRYSSLRKPRQLGPRTRILNQREPLAIQRKPAPTPLAAIHPSPNDHSEPPSPHPLIEVPPTPPGGVLTYDSPGTQLLVNQALVVTRQIEMMNVFLVRNTIVSCIRNNTGFEQANKYAIVNEQGGPVGYIAEQEDFLSTVQRQLLRTHRRFEATILDSAGNVLFKIRRPFTLINSRIFISTAQDELIGEVQQIWHPWRRKYDLFVRQKQFAHIDEGFLAWDFRLQNEDGGLLGQVNRNFVGLARELFTDTGQYVVRMDATEGNVRGLTLDERAVTLALAITADIDYFSRHSQHANGGFLPIGLFGGGGELRDEERDSSKAPTASSGDPTSGASAMSEDGSIPPTARATSHNVHQNINNEVVWDEDPFEEQGQNSEGFFKGWGDGDGGWGDS